MPVAKWFLTKRRGTKMLGFKFFLENVLLISF